MKKGVGCILAALLGVVVVAVLVGFSGYNKLVSQEESVDAAWAQVENAYQRRADLIPNLVSTVRGAADFERETFLAVTEARSKVGQMNINGVPDAQQLAQFEQTQSGLSQALSRLLLVVERYPDLKATQNFRDLQAQLEGTENRISIERQRFNEAARAFNTSRRKFPTVLVASLMGFEAKPYFASKPGSDEPPKVEF